ncbi:MAG TPA: cytochrome c [Nitrospiria bacterium]
MNRSIPMSGLLIAAMVLAAGPSVLGGEKGMMGGDHMGGGKKGMMGGPMKDHMEVTSVEIPGFSTDQLPDPESEEAGLLLRYCTQCHNLPSPATHGAEEWPEVVERMDRHMKMAAGGGHREMMRIKRPTPKELGMIEAYLQTHALKIFSNGLVPESSSPGGQLFIEVCSGCHVLPDIALHPPDEWPDVVERMRMNMKILGKEGISAEQRDRIVDYLRKHSE